jgi:hypothetical protein
VLTGIHSKNVLCLNLSCLHDGFFGLFVVLLGDNFELLSCFLQHSFFGLKLVGCSVQLVSQLFVLLGNLIIPARNLVKSCFEDVNLNLLAFDQFTVFVLFGLK